MSSLQRLRLCQELIDMIVDYAHDDFDTLRSCSLASRHFVPCTRYHLFKRMHLMSSKWVDFLNIVESPLSTITHIHIVRVEGQGLDLHSIMTRLQHLRPHSLSLAEMQCMQCNGLDQKITGFCDLTRLTIMRSSFPGPFVFIDMISKLRALKHLCLFHLYFRVDHDTVKHSSADDHHLVEHSSTAPSLETLELHFCSIPEVLALVQTRLDISALHNVAFTDVTLRSLAPVGRFLCSLGPLLIHLELQLAEDSVLTVEQIEKHLNLSFNNNLRHIHIVLPDYVGLRRRIYAAQSKAFSSYALILSQITSTSIGQVILSEGDEAQDETINLTQLPDVVLALKGKQFAHVQRVALPPLNWGNGLEAKEYLKTEWKEWERRGILVFEHVSGYYDKLHYV